MNRVAPLNFDKLTIKKRTQRDGWTSLAAEASDVLGTFFISAVLPGSLALALALLWEKNPASGSVQ